MASTLRILARELAVGAGLTALLLACGEPAERATEGEPGAGRGGSPVSEAGASAEPATARRAPRAAGDEPYDLVIVTLDTVRADRLSCYGYGRDTTPHLDALAAGGLRFTRCLAPVPTTLPSHTSMITGVMPLRHGVLANLHQGLVYERDPGLQTLAQALAERGYATAGFVSALPLRRGTGIEDGFQTYDQPKRLERPGSRTTDRALAWLAKAPVPAFLWVHWFDPHNPYEPPSPHDEAFDAQDGVVEAWMAARAVPATAERLGGRSVDLREANEAYDGELRATDAELGRLVAALQARGRWDRTVLIVIGDHGEGLGQHGEPAHGLAWDDHTRVPWVIHGPGIEPGTIDEVCSATDLLPTVLPLLPALSLERLEDQCSGVDRLAGPGEGAPVHTQSSPRQREDRALDHAVTDARWKLLRTSAGEERLYDLLADPHELEDVAAQHPGERERLARALDASLAAERADADGRVRAATEAEQAGLQALGYGGGDESGGE